MTILKAAQWLCDHYEQIDPSYEVSISLSPAELVDRLLGAPEDIEESQARGIAEWQELIERTDEPRGAAELILEWFCDYTQARADAANFRDWDGQSEDKRQPWSDGRVP